MKIKVMVHRAVATIAMSAFGLGLFGCGGENATQTASAPEPKPQAEAVSKVAMTTANAKPKTENAIVKPKNTDGKGIAWATSFEAARAEAKKQNKALMIDFYTDWCGACKMLNEQVFPQPDVVKASRQFVNVKVNAEKRQDIANQYGVAAFPTIIWIRADGVPILRQDGASAESAHLVAQMESAQARFAALQQ